MTGFTRRGAAIIVESLQAQGVKTIFGYPGASVLELYDELYTSPVRHILVRHEQAAAHAADGFARASGQTGVCLATSGPGACNLITGIATAFMDSSPVVAITGQVSTGLLGNDAFQEADITGITMPVTKHNYLVRNAGDLGRVIKEAFFIAGTGRKGPVLIDVPRDVSIAHIHWDNREEPVQLRGYRPTHHGHPRQVEKAVAMIMNAECPVIYAGGGVIASSASKDLLELAERMLIPVTTTLMGLGSIPGDHPLNLGMLGMHGTVQANYAVTGCDLLIAAGVRFDDRVTGKIGSFAPGAQVIHIDIDPAEIGKNMGVHLPVVGDVRTILQQMLAILVRGNDHESWRRRIAGWREAHPVSGIEDGSLHPQFIICSMSEVLKENAIIVTEVGQHQMWTAQHYSFKYPRQLITSGGLGTMGFGLPASMGAHFACPDIPVFDISGDGSLQMNIQEFGTIAQYRIPVKIVVMNNMYLGMVRQWQELFYDRKYAFTELPPVDFVKIAGAYGIDGIRVESCDEVKTALKAAIDTEGPFLLDFRIEREDNVYPMVPAGAAVNEMILGIPP